MVNRNADFVMVFVILKSYDFSMKELNISPTTFELFLAKLDDIPLLGKAMFAEGRRRAELLGPVASLASLSSEQDYDRRLGCDMMLKVLETKGFPPPPEGCWLMTHNSGHHTR